MLLGYDPESGVVEFVFTDSNYLDKLENIGKTVGIKDLWPSEQGRRLKEFVTSAFPGNTSDYYKYRIVNGQIIPRPELVIEVEGDAATVGNPIVVRLSVSGFQDGEKVDAVRLSVKGGGISGEMSVPIQDGIGNLSITPTEIGRVVIAIKERVLYSQGRVVVTVTDEA